MVTAGAATKGKTKTAKQKAGVENTQQPGIKGMASMVSKVPVAAMLKAEMGCSVWPTAACCWREMRSSAPMAVAEGIHECGRPPGGTA